MYDSRDGGNHYYIALCRIPGIGKAFYCNALDFRNGEMYCCCTVCNSTNYCYSTVWDSRNREFIVIEGESNTFIHFNFVFRF